MGNEEVSFHNLTRHDEPDPYVAKVEVCCCQAVLDELIRI